MAANTIQSLSKLNGPCKRRIATAAACAGLLIGLGSGAAVGGELRATNYPSVVLKYDDLNLASEAGVLALSRRISAAASAVCGGRPDLRDQLAIHWSAVCRRSAMARAAQQVGNPRLAALLATHDGQS